MRSACSVKVRTNEDGLKEPDDVRDAIGRLASFRGLFGVDNSLEESFEGALDPGGSVALQLVRNLV
jgi:hypothetical protein